MNKNRTPNQSPLSYLLVAGGALLFYMAALPIIDSISNLIQNKMNCKSAEVQREVAKIQKEVQDMQVGEGGQVHAIGFDINSNEMEVEDE